jgi:hypothetical protein
MYRVRETFRILGPEYHYPIPFDDSCHNLEEQDWDKTSSIDTKGQCIFTYELENCHGKQVKFAPNCGSTHGCNCSDHSQLYGCAWDNEIRSYTRCNFNIFFIRKILGNSQNETERQTASLQSFQTSLSKPKNGVCQLGWEFFKPAKKCFKVKILNTGGQKVTHLS